MLASSSGTDDLRALLALPEDLGAELILGTITRKAAPSFEHGDSQSALSQALKGPFHRRPGGPGGPGGWWIATEVDVWFDDANVLRPDLVGWRRDHLPERPSGRPVRARPDWVGEVLSPSTARRDLWEKANILHAAGVPHYWLLDPERQTLTVCQRAERGWLIALVAGPGDRVRAEPFEAIELAVGALFGLEEDTP